MTEDFQEDDNIDLLPLETVCPACRLAQHAGGFSLGVCSDCLVERFDNTVFFGTA